MKQLTSSVIIPTRNRLDDVIICLDSLRKQTLLPDEIFIIDSSDKRLIDNKKFSSVFNSDFFDDQIRLVYKHTKRVGAAYQRNIAMVMARSAIFYFFDDDVILEHDYIQTMNNFFAANPEYGGGMGTITNIPEKKTDKYRLFRTVFGLHRIYASGNFTFSGMPTHCYGAQEIKKVEALGGCCMALKAQLCKEYMFDEALGRYSYMEDCDLSWRVSRRVPLFFNPAAKLRHMASPEARDSIADNRATYIKNYTYLFFKNFYSENRFRILAYIWSVFGLMLEALLLRNWNYLKGYCRGLKCYYLRH